jgi:ABC-type lipoprotein export system ATPase subunit
MTLFREIHAHTGVTILLVTHSIQLGSFGSRALRMAGGEFVDGEE